MSTDTMASRSPAHPRLKPRLSPKAVARIESLMLPAAKAYVLGYAMDVLPAILKALLRFLALEAKRIRVERARGREEIKANPENREEKLKGFLSHLGPSILGVPSLLRAVMLALTSALGPSGMALSCFLAMAGWRISESLFWWPVVKYWTLRTSHGRTDKAGDQLLKRARVAATLISVSISSAVSLMALQHSWISASQASSNKRIKGGQLKPVPAVEHLTIDTDSSSWIPKALRSPLFNFDRLRGPRKTSRPTPLAPGGHFLARLTSLTVPTSPSVGRSPGAVSPNHTYPHSPTETRAPSISTSDPPDSLTSGTTFRINALGRPSPTIDLTLFALVRGLDTFVRALPQLLKSESLKETAKGKGKVAGKKGVAAQVAGALIDQTEGLVFVVCCAQIMWSWFYHPERLPPSYVKWITNLAAMDERLLIALRSMRYGQPLRWQYGSQDVTPAGIDLCCSLSEQLGHPYEWGDPTRLPRTANEARSMLQAAKLENAKARTMGQEVISDPLRGGEPGFVLAGAAGPRGRGEMGGLPCEIVHCGVGGASCYKNAALRWLRGWRMSMAIYVPVHLLPRLIFNPKGFLEKPIENALKVLVGSARSAAFLATFIVGNWFPICLARTAILPRLLPNVDFRFWDSGLGPRLGSIACGFSVFIEEKRKRAEMALYVAPRALFALAESLMPGWLSEGRRGALWAERFIFGLSVGIVVTAGRYRPDLLRGITSTMGWVVKPPSANYGPHVSRRQGR
ncbi:hypothetical protein IE53DRAFT_645 [Violaceomyces palustris]|uniref:Uncharacterized protein n=1 Tax=Violaceomyces palustris TaxID=1673888 RepID=A0ACD0P8U7_9BASI|nr:hypothetical protein IE53DRAFT_645 [Violaceomyces palustris]